MTARLDNKGERINRKKRLSFLFNGKKLIGYEGDTIASALLANDKKFIGRSFKYHRPRGIVASGTEEPNALMGIGEGKFFTPNERASTTLLRDGMVVTSQNHWPTLDYDIWSILSFFGDFFSAGFYYKIFIWPRFAWKYIYEPFIRLSAGLGQPPKQNDGDTYEHFYAHTDVLIVGGGLAGLELARALSFSGEKILLMEQLPYLGGRLLSDSVEIDGVESRDWVRNVSSELKKKSNVKVVVNTVVSGIYDHGYVVANETVSNYIEEGNIPRERLWKIRAKKIVTATGAIERPLIFAGNDLPGVMLSSAARDFMCLYGVSIGDRTVIVTNNDNAYRTASILHDAGLTVAMIIDIRRDVSGDWPKHIKNLGIDIKTGYAVANVLGKKSVEAVEICGYAGEGSVLETVECDAVLMSGGWSPAVHLWSHCGGKLDWKSDKNMFVPSTNSVATGSDGMQNVFPLGSSNGYLLNEDVLSDVERLLNEMLLVGINQPKGRRKKRVNEFSEAPTLAVTQIPQAASRKLLKKAFIDFQNDVKVTDIELAAREGFESVEHAKRYTTLGMATDQGKLSNINGISLLAKKIGKSIPDIGTTTFRPPYVPVSLGSITGAEKKALFKPTRKTVIDQWHDRNQAFWEPVGDWRRPFSYIKESETVEKSVEREVRNTRMNVGILDASTLGKILVSGPDSGKFLDLIYTNMMSTLPIGKCKYGLMCNENGFLFDDGVVVRLNKDSYLCHTTSGGASAVVSWMEEWHQTEWWTMKVFITDLTEQYCQISVAGPKSRELLSTITNTKLSEKSLPFMSYKPVKVEGVDGNLFRISFSGELAYELAVPADTGLKIWESIIEKGKKFKLMPYGTEALHIMRAEKGFIMIGDETDGTVIPQDLNLGWAISKKKKDYLGMRAHEREFFKNPKRKKLVGLLTNDPKVVLPEGGQIVETLDGSNLRKPIGHITSTYFSPSLGHSIAMALLEGGLDKLGESVAVATEDHSTVPAKVVKPVFLD